MMDSDLLRSVLQHRWNRELIMKGEVRMDKKFLLVEGEFGQCSYATLNYDGEPSLAYCAKLGKIMDGWTVMNYCRGNGGCGA